MTAATDVLNPFAFPSLIRSVGTQISRRRFVTKGFICTLKSHVLCPVPSISSTISNQSSTYMPFMTQCKRSFGLSDIEQLCENVTHAEKHTPDDKEHLHLRIHQDVLDPRSITMYSTFLPLPFHRLLLQVVIGHVTLSHRSLSSPVLHLQLMTCLPLCSGRDFTDFFWPYSFWLPSTTSLKLTVAIFAVSSANLPSRCSGPFSLLSDTTKKSLHVSRALNDVRHQWL